MFITPVPPDFLYAVWPDVVKLFRPAIEYAGGRFDEEDVLSDLQKQLTGLWIAVDDNHEIIAAISVRVVDYPKRRFARYEVVGSKPNTMVKKWGYPMFEAIEKHAKTVMKCSGIEGAGRFGWRKMSGRTGYKPVTILVEKDL